jgi:hypothetical protein
MIDYSKILQQYYPGTTWSLNGDEYSGLIWRDETVPQPTQEELDALWAPTADAFAKKKCKEEASALLYETDWTQIPDCPLVNKQEFFDWRAIIRNYALNPVVDPVFPPKPETVWT